MNKTLLKRLTLLMCLLCAAVVLSSCTALPLMRLSSMLPEQGTTATQAATTQASDTVTLTRAEYERYRKFDTLLDILDRVEERYYQPLDEQTLLDSAAAGLLDGVDDPYTFFYTAEEYQAMWEEDEGQYAGIGIQISINYTTQICTIARVFEGGPAEQAGVCRGDILYKVEDLYVTSDNVEEAIKLMRREPGTQVNVSFLRDGEQMDYLLTCATVTTNRVESTMMDDTIGYIRLYEFAGDCAEKFQEALEKLVGEGAKGIIIDLRDNGGGWVSDAESIGNLFLDAGVLCYLEYRDGSRQYYRTRDGKTDVALVVLVNENSASASEILTGALRDRANATVVGTQSYGKGIVQEMVPVGDQGAAMQYTVAQYFTPNGYAVHKVGITPDVEVELPEEDIRRIFNLADLADAQVNRAYEVMKEKLQ